MEQWRGEIFRRWRWVYVSQRCDVLVMLGYEGWRGVTGIGVARVQAWKEGASIWVEEIAASMSYFNSIYILHSI